MVKATKDYRIILTGKAPERQMMERYLQSHDYLVKDVAGPKSPWEDESIYVSYKGQGKKMAVYKGSSRSKLKKMGSIKTPWNDGFEERYLEELAHKDFSIDEEAKAKIWPGFFESVKEHAPSYIPEDLLEHYAKSMFRKYNAEKAEYNRKNEVLRYLTTTAGRAELKRSVELLQDTYETVGSHLKTLSLGEKLHKEAIDACLELDKDSIPVDACIVSRFMGCRKTGTNEAIQIYESIEKDLGKSLLELRSNLNVLVDTIIASPDWFYKKTRELERADKYLLDGIKPFKFPSKKKIDEIERMTHDKDWSKNKSAQLYLMSWLAGANLSEQLEIAEKTAAI